MIEVTELRKIFRRRRETVVAVDGVSFRCHPGEIFGLLGANGAGKTTVLRMLATILRPTEGRALVGGYDLLTESNRVRREIGFMSTATALYGRLTAEEMILYAGRLQGMAERELRERAEELIERLGIGPFRKRRCERCSTGMKQRISIARALIHNPSVMIFDEPTIGLDLLAARGILNFIRECREEGKTVLFSTHIMSEVERLCDRIAIIDRGKIRASGRPEELREAFGEEEIEEIFYRILTEGEER